MSGSAFDQVNLQVIDHNPCPWGTCAERAEPFPATNLFALYGFVDTLFPQGPEIKSSMEAETVCHYFIGRRKIVILI